MKSESFHKYEAAYNSYDRKVGGKNVPREMRLFNIRLNLAMGMKIEFEYPKTKEVKKAYTALFEVVGLWNVFEAFGSWQKCEWNEIIKRENFNDKITQEPLMKTIKELSDLYKKKQNEFQDYFSLLNEIGLREKRKSKIKLISKKLEDSKDILPEDLIELIYSERNMFYHLGEAAKKRMKYPTVIKLLTIYKNTLSEYISLIAKRAIDCIEA